MKTVFLALTIAYAAFLHETIYAGTSDAMPQQAPSESSANTSATNARSADHAADDGKTTDGKPSDVQARERGRGSEKNRTRSRIGMTINRPERFPKTENPRSGNATVGSPARTSRPGGFERRGLLQHETFDNPALPTRPSGVVSRAGRSDNRVRHRSSNSAVIDGSTNGNAKERRGN